MSSPYEPTKKSLQDVIGRSFLSLCWINQPIFGLNWLGGTRNVGGLAISGPRPLRFSGDLEATFEGSSTKLPQVGPRTKAPARYQAPVVGGLFGWTGGGSGNLGSFTGFQWR